MKTQSTSFRRGFTLVEMLAVITIIAVLAAMVIAGTKYAQNKQARDSAKVQIKLLSAALEQYKLDTGTYPIGASAGKNDTKILYRALFWDSNDNGAGADTDHDQTIYIAELDPDNNKQGWIEGKKSEAIIIDPWKNEYRFRSGKMSDGKANPEAKNPDFDLWSAGPDGKTSTSAKNKDTDDDILDQ